MRFWIVAGAGIGLAAVALAIVPRLIDWNSHRADIETAAARLTGHDVSVRGPIQVRFLPRPTLTARDVSVIGSSERPIGYTLNARQADVTFDIGSLVTGRSIVSDLRLRRPALTIDEESSARLGSWPPRPQDWAASLKMPDLSAVHIVDGRIELAGRRSDRRASLSNVSFEFRMDDQDGTLEAAGLFKLERHDITLNAAFTPPDERGFRSSKLSIQAQNAMEETTTFRFSGDIGPALDEGRPGDSSPSWLNGRMTLDGPDLQHALAALSAATGYPSTFGFLAPSQAFTIDGPIDADQVGLRSEELKLSLSERLGKGRIDLQLLPERRLDLNLDLPNVRLTDEADFQGFLPLDVLSKLQVPPGEIELAAREIAYRNDAARRGRLRLSTTDDGRTSVNQASLQLPGLVDLRFEGRVDKGDVGPMLKGRLAAVGDDLRSTLTWLDLIGDDDPGGGWRGFSLESDVDVTSVEMALSNLDMRLDSSRVSGMTGLRFGERRRLRLDLDIERPNLDLYLGNRKPSEINTWLSRGFDVLDADIDLQLNRLVWQGINIEEARISINADNGELALNDVFAQTVGNTTLALNGTVDLQGRTAELEGDLESTHPTRALNHLKIYPPRRPSRPQPISLSGRLHGMVDRFDLKLQMDYDEGQAVIEGQAGWRDDQPWYDLTFDGGHPDYQALIGPFGLAPLVPTGDAEGPLELAGRLRHGSDRPWTASGSLLLGPTSFTGSVAFDDGPFEGWFDAKLSVGAPQKDSLAPFLILAGLRLAGDWAPERWLGRLPGLGLRTAWLDKADGSLSLQAKGGLVGEGLALEARLSDGLLHIGRLEASPWEGRLNAELALQRRRGQPFAAIAMDLERIEAALFADWLGIASGLDGPVDLRVEASSAGRTPYELMAALEGGMEIAAGPGTIDSLGMPVLKQTLLAAQGAKPPVDRSPSLPFRAFDAKATLSRGILTLQDARLITDPASADSAEIRVDGTADLLLWIVDLTLSTEQAGDDVAGAVGNAEEAGSPSAARSYRVVGPPHQLEGFATSGN